MFQSTFLEFEFFLLVLFSIIVPVGIYSYLMWKKAISRKTVLLFGTALIILSGIDIVLLQKLKEMVEHSSSMLDDVIFASELSITLYLLPAVFAGVGINVVSHILISHLVDAEKRFDQAHPERQGDAGSRPGRMDVGK